MGMWGSKKVRDRYYSSFYTNDEDAIDLAKTSAYVACKQHMSFTEVFNTQIEHCFYTKLMGAQKWARKHFIWGTFDSKERSTRISKPKLKAYIESLEGESITIRTSSTAPLNPLIYLQDVIRQDYPGYEPGDKLGGIYEYDGTELVRINSSILHVSKLVAVFKNPEDKEDTVQYELDIDTNSQLDLYVYATYVLDSNPEEVKHIYYNITKNNNVTVNVSVLPDSKKWFFLAPLRIKKTNLYNTSDPELKKIWKSSFRLINKLNINAKYISKQLFTGKGASNFKKINEAYITFGVPISSTSQYLDKYIYYFIEYLYKQYGSNNYIKLQDYLSGFLLEWGTITREIVDHSGKRSRIYKTKEGKNFCVYRNISSTRAIKYSVRNLELTDIVLNETAVSEDIPKNLYDSSYVKEGGFIFPLNTDVLKKLSVSDRNRVCLTSTRLVFDYHEKVSKSFFETKLGKFVKLNFRLMELMNDYLLFGELGVLFATVLKNTFIGKIYNKFMGFMKKLQNMPMQLTVRVFLKVLGPIVTIIIAVVAAIVMSIYGQSAAASKLLSFVLQEVIKQMFTALVTELGRYIQKDMKKISNQMKSLNKEMEEFQQELDMHKKMNGMNAAMIAAILSSNAMQLYTAVSGKTYEYLTRLPTDVQDKIDSIFDWERDFLMPVAITPAQILLGNTNSEVLLG